MPKLDRRKLLQAGVAIAVPLGSLPLIGCQQSTSKLNDANDSKNDSSKVTETKNAVTEQLNPEIKQDNKRKTMQIQYLEIVTPEVDALCKQYAAIHGITFSEPVAEFGNARTAKLSGGGQIGIRAPMRETETPVVRPYGLVDDIEAALAAAADAGAEIAMPAMEIPGHGKFAIVIHGGIDCGLWQN